MIICRCDLADGPVSQGSFHGPRTDDCSRERRSRRGEGRGGGGEAEEGGGGGRERLKKEEARGRRGKEKGKDVFLRRGRNK